VRGTPERLPLVGLGFGAKQENRRADSGLPEGIGPDPTCAKFFNDRVGEAAESVGLCLKVLPLLVDVSNDDVSPVDIGTNAASQLHIIEMDNGHSTLTFKRRKAFRGPVYDHLRRDGRDVQKSTGCLGSFGVIAIIPSERQQRKGGLASDKNLNRLFRFDI
jgi:hypothetical protein